MFAEFCSKGFEELEVFFKVGRIDPCVQCDDCAGLTGGGDLGHLTHFESGSVEYH